MPKKKISIKPLRFHAFDHEPSASFGRIDRQKDQAVIVRVGLPIPTIRVVKPLSLIAGAQILKRENVRRGPLYGIAIRLHKGKAVKFGCRSRQAALELLETLHRYLKVETRH